MRTTERRKEATNGKTESNTEVQETGNDLTDAAIENDEFGKSDAQVLGTGIPTNKQETDVLENIADNPEGNELIESDSAAKANSIDVYAEVKKKKTQNCYESPGAARNMENSHAYEILTTAVSPSTDYYADDETLMYENKDLYNHFSDDTKGNDNSLVATEVKPAIQSIEINVVKDATERKVYENVIPETTDNETWTN